MIFEDPARRRWRRALIVFGTVAVSAVFTVGLVATGFIVPPPVPDSFSRRSIMSPAQLREFVEQEAKPRYTQAQLERRKRIQEQEKRRRDRLARNFEKGVLPLPDDALVAFVIPDDPPSLESLEKHLGQIDVVVPTIFELGGAGCEITERSDPLVQRVLNRADVLVFPRVANLQDDVWQGEAVARMMRSDQMRGCVVQKLVERVTAIGADGLNVDIEELAPEDSEALLDFLVDLRAALHKQKLRLTVDVPLYDPAYDFEYIGAISDAVMVMAYDEHYPGSAPGPVASRRWFADALSEAESRLPANRIVIVLGAYGYDWNLDAKKPGVGLGFRSLMDLALAAGTRPAFEADAENGHFGYRDPDGDTHEVWFQDALSLWNQWLMTRKHGLKRLGFWRLGTEDEAIWSFLGQEPPPLRPDQLENMPPGRSVEFYGEGEILSVRALPEAGVRKLAINPEATITEGRYLKVPSGFLVEARGGAPKQVVLTFDDGPSEEWTPAILDVLKAADVRATFFVIGEEAMRAPDIVEREIEEGHLVGNHSFSHPHMEQLTPRELRSQLASTQRLIEGLTGRRTPLFRAPYTASIEDASPTGVAPYRAALEHGYVMVGANVDSRDWARPGVDAIVKSVLDGLNAGRGQVVLFHDGGGDRSQTAEAVARLLPALAQQGFQVVSLEQLLNVRRSVLERPLPMAERAISWSSAIVARTRAWGWTVLAALFFACTLLAVLRILFLGALTLWEASTRPKARVETQGEFRPLVTVLIPAFNEEKVIAQTVSTLLGSEYRNIEVLVVDDGSSDRTAEEVRAIAARDDRVKLLQQTNSGKAGAANRGLEEARGEIVVAVDADTLVAPKAIPKLVRHFQDPSVTAVCGNVEVGNVRGALTAFQAIEYVTSQNFDRRAFSALNCISVVPGALGAWRRGAVLAAGGYSSDTLTEDADLTLTILRRGGKVVYEAEATGRTEAPETIGALLRQRFRWTFGTYQCLWKHKRALFKEGAVGFVGLPNMILFQILFPTLSPLGDIVMLLSIFRGDWAAFWVGYLAFLVMDTCASILAFALDRKPFWWLLLLVVQRFTYRQIMYYVCLKAMLAALKGSRHGWRKLDRTGTVRAHVVKSATAQASSEQ